MLFQVRLDASFSFPILILLQSAAVVGFAGLAAFFHYNDLNSFTLKSLKFKCLGKGVYFSQQVPFVFILLHHR